MKWWTDAKVLKSTTKSTRRDPVARVLKSAASPYIGKVEQVDKGEPTICPQCKGQNTDCYVCDGEGELWQ